MKKIFLIFTILFSVFSVHAENSSSFEKRAEWKNNTNSELLDWYTLLGQVRALTADETPAGIKAEVVLGYRKDDKETAQEIKQRTIEIRDFLRRYFSEKRYAELLPKNQELLKIEIRDAINESILSNSKIRNVQFLSLELNAN